MTTYGVAPMHIVLAHPLTEPGGLGVPPLFVAAVVVALAVVVVRWWPSRPPSSGTVSEDPTPAWLPVRLAVAGMLVLAVVAGRVGRDSQVDNIAPSLAVGLAWPVVLALVLAAPRAWARISPFDTLAGGLERLAGQRDAGDDPPPLPGGVWWAVPSGAVWCWYLGVNPDVLEPRAVGLALAGYTLLMLTGCQVVGRRRWLRQAEVVTVLAGTVAASRRGSPRHDPGLAALVGVVAGGLAFGTLRFSQLWIQQVADLGANPFAARTTVPGLLVAMVLGALCLLGAERWSAAAGATPGTVIAGVATVAAGIGLAQGLLRERLVKAAILVVARASNPLGGDNDLFGTADLLPANTILGDDVRVLIQLAVITVAAVAAGIAASRRHDPARARPALVMVGTFTVIGVLSVTAV